MDPETREELAVLVPVILFLTVALVGTVLVAGWYLDHAGLISRAPRISPDHPSVKYDVGE